MKRALIYLLTYLILLTPVAGNVWADEHGVIPRTSPTEKQASEAGRAVIEQLALLGDSTYAQGIIKGRVYARNQKTGRGYFAGGIAAGMTLGLFGAGFVMAVSQSGDKEPPASEIVKMESKSSEYQIGYLDGFNRQAKSRALGSALIGGVFGSAFLALIYVAAAAKK